MSENFSPKFDSSVYERAKKFLQEKKVNGDTPALDEIIEAKKKQEEARKKQENAAQKEEKAAAQQQLTLAYGTLGSGTFRINDYSKPVNDMSLSKMKPTEAPKPAEPVKPAEQQIEPTSPKEEAKRIASETNTTIFITQDSTEIIKAMYKMNKAEGGTDLNNKSMEDAIGAYGKKGGVSGAHYSYETLVKAANDTPSTHTQEFGKLINQLVQEGKIKKNENGTYVENIKGGGVILSLNDGDPAFLVHEGRHAEASFYDLRNNIEALSTVEGIIQNQSLEWKKKALKFFLGKPYWEGLSEPSGLKWDGKEDKDTYLARYLTASEGNILINPDKKAWMIDEFVAYASDGNNKDIPDIPEMKDFAKRAKKETK